MRRTQLRTKRGRPAQAEGSKGTRVGYGASCGGALRVYRVRDVTISSDLLAGFQNCGAIATLSRFLHSATLPGGLLGRIPTHANELGARHDN